MKKAYISVSKVLWLAVVTLCWVGCKSGDGGGSDPTDPPSVSGVVAVDVSNNGDASDIQVSFAKPTGGADISSYRIYVVNADEEDFTEASAEIATEYVEISKNDESRRIRLSADLNDVNGDLIVEDKPYRIYVSTIYEPSAEKGTTLSEGSSTLTLAQESAVRTLTRSLNEGTGGMDTDAEGNIYMADFGAATNDSDGTNVIKISPEGEVHSFAFGFSGASGNDFDNEGNLYQSNIGGNTVSKIAPDGNVTTFATGFTNPVGIAFDGSSNFYVCNCGNNTISKVDMSGNVSLFATSTLFNCPNGIDIDDSGNIYVASFSSATIVKITPAGVVSSFATMPGNNNGHLLINGNFIYVVSRGLHQIHKVSFSGAVSLMAGSGRRGITDGPLSTASFSLPNDIAFSPDGKYMYVNDVNGSNSNPTIISPSIVRVIELVE